MARTPGFLKVKHGDDGRTPVYLTTIEPLLTNGVLPMRVATMHKLSGFAGNARDNAEFLVLAWNSHDGLMRALRNIEAACVTSLNAAATCKTVCAIATAAIAEVGS